MPRNKTFITLIEPVLEPNSDEFSSFRAVPNAPDFETIAKARKWVEENFDRPVEFHAIRFIGSIKQSVEQVKKTTISMGPA